MWFFFFLYVSCVLKTDTSSQWKGNSNRRESMITELFYLISSRKNMSYFHLVFASCWTQPAVPCEKARGSWSDLLSPVSLDRCYQGLCVGQRVQRAQTTGQDDTNEPSSTSVGAVELASSCLFPLAAHPPWVPVLESEGSATSCPVALALRLAPGLEKWEDHYVLWLMFCNKYELLGQASKSMKQNHFV